MAEMPIQGSEEPSNADKSRPQERDKFTVSGKQVSEAVRKVAIAYVGIKLGIVALKFIGGKLRGSGTRREDAPSAATQQRPQSFVRGLNQQAASSSEDSWAVVDSAAPETPQGYKPIVDAALPCSPQELYSILFSGPGTDLYLKQHRELGKQWDLVATGWRRAPAAGVPAGVGASAAVAAAAAGDTTDGSLLGQQTVFEYVLGRLGSGGFTRLLTFWNPKKPPSTVDTRCVQRQQFCVYRGGVLLFATAMNMLDIPFKECFTVNTLWRVQPGAAPGTCSLTINLKVQFIKRALGVGAIISATTFRDSEAFFRSFVANVDAHVRSIREQAAAPLPASLPLALQHGGGSRAVSRPTPSRSQIVSPFAVASGAAAPGAAAGGASSGSAVGPSAVQQPAALPVWRQLRALLVVSVLAFMVLHQLHLSRQLEALRADTGGADGSGGSGGGGGLAAQAGGLLAAALGPVATATGSLHLVLQALVDRVGGRAPPAP